MSNKILLCGHTGSLNRGCEAIIRSTAIILSELGINDIKVLSFDKKYDEYLKLDKVIDIEEYPDRNFLNRLLGAIKRKIFRDPMWSSLKIYNNVFKNIDKETTVFNVGGDTYCYGEPYFSYALNDIANFKNIDNIFWGCSLSDSAFKSKRMQDDINKYKFIVTRETLSEKIFKEVVNEKDKVILACDPAFHLNIKETELPDGFKIDNTVGINLSPLVFKDYNNPDDIMNLNIKELIDWIINNTDMNVCLIPHVYNIKTSLQDIGVLKKIKSWYPDNKRISIVDRDLSCCELKYIISNCRFFVGARTHATIAAYSTEVPALAISYSIKSRGIAKDLFGKEDGFVFSYKSLKSKYDVKNMFVDNIVANEDFIKKRYKEILPDYKESILIAAKRVLEI